MEEGLTLQQVRDAAGKTWFKFTDCPGHVLLESNLNMDAQYQIAGKKDKVEGQRLTILLRRAFPEYKVSTSTLEEWVSVTIHKQPIN